MFSAYFELLHFCLLDVFVLPLIVKQKIVQIVDQVLVSRFTKFFFVLLFVWLEQDLEFINDSLKVFDHRVELLSEFFWESVDHFSQCIVEFFFKDHFLCLYWISHMLYDEFFVFFACSDEPIHGLFQVTFSALRIFIFTEFRIEI